MSGRPRKDVEPVNEPAEVAEGGIYLDPDLADLRDAEIKKLSELPPLAPRGLVEDPSIDPALVEAREAEVKRGDKKLV